MAGLRLLHVWLERGAIEEEVIRRPDVLGPVDLAVAMDRPGDQVTVLGTGPLAGHGSANASWLVVAGRSPIWGGLMVDFLGPAGPAWVSFGVDAVVLHGRAPVPCALELTRDPGTGLGQRVVPLDPDTAWTGFSIGDTMGIGIEALRHRLIAEGFGAMSSGHGSVLLTGPAAARSRMGSLRYQGVYEEAPPEGPDRLLVARGGFGSRLVQTHGLLALAFDTNTENLLHAQGSPEFELSAPEPVLPANNLTPLREWLTYFNSRSAYYLRQSREELYELLVARTLLSQLEATGRPSLLLPACGKGCDHGCQAHGISYRRSDEPVLAMGLQLGVFDYHAISALVRFVGALGLDLLEVAGLVAWLLECLDSGWLQPAEVGVSSRPFWDPELLDPDMDSDHNATVAGEILEHLFLNPATKDPRLREFPMAIEAVGGRAGETAVYLVSDAGGWLCPAPVWSVDALLPTPIPVRGLLHDRYEWLPPGELGVSAARHLVSELAMANLGFCPEHREVALGGGLDQAMDFRAHGAISWEEHHRRLAKVLDSRLHMEMWPTRRVRDMLKANLVHAQLALPPDQQLDRWVARMHRDVDQASERLFRELREGIERGLG